MRTWTRATAETLCGGVCRHTRIAPGEPMLVATLPLVKRPRVRCHTCAGEPVPADLPSVLEQRRVEPIRAMARLGLLPLDEAQALTSVGREPGQEG